MAKPNLRKFGVFPLENMDAREHEYVDLVEIMPPATLHGVRVITKLYFVIIAAFKESMTLYLAQRSFNVIHFGGNRKLVYDFM